MRYIKLIIFLFLSVGSTAQVVGIVKDSASGKELAGVVVGRVVKSKPGDTTYVLTGEKGDFKFDSVPHSSFSLIFSYVGYRPVAKYVPVVRPQNLVNLGNVIIVSSAKMLGEVIVEAPPVTIKEDTVEYRADAFKVKENAVVEDLLKKLPGVTVDKDGNITAQGKSVTKVRVNGKDFFGGDPKTATRELPANIVDKVQIIDDYGDQATVSGIKDGTPEKVLNLQLKKDKSQGYFGRLTAGIGDKERYQASFNGNYFNNNQQISLFSNSNNTNQSLFSFGSGNNMQGRGLGSMMKMGQGMLNDMGGAGSIVNAMNNGDQGFFQAGGSNDGITINHSVGFNYRDQWSKKVSVYGSYSYSHRNTNAYTITAQQNFNLDKIILYNKTEDASSASANHRAFFNLEYNIDSLNFIKFSPSFSLGISDGDNAIPYFTYKRNDTLTIDGNNHSINQSKTPNVSGNILFNHRFKKRGRNFSANLTLGSSENNSTLDSRYLTSRYEQPFPGSFNSDQFIDQANSNHNSGIRLTYSEPLSTIRSLDFVLSHNLSYSRNNKRTFFVDPATHATTLLDSLSNDYENDFYTNRLNVSLRSTFKKYNYTLGISFQPVDLRGFSISKDSNYTPVKRINVFPVARFAYNFSKMKSVSINYTGSAQQPTFTQLQDITDRSNPLYLSRGNPNLKPSINHNINLFFNNFNIVTGKVIFTNFLFSTVQNQIINNVILIGNSGAQLTVPQNVNGYYNLNGFYSFSKPYKNRKYVLTLNGNLNYNHNINLVNNLRNIGNNWVISQGLNVEWNPKDWLEFGLGGNYSSNTNTYQPEDGIKRAGLQNSSSNAFRLSSNLNIDLPKNWVLKYDLEYTVNQGLGNSVLTNPAIMNASIEKQLFKKKNGILRFQGFDLFNQNSNINRSVTSNAIIDTRSNRLTRYFLLSFTYRLQKFKGKQPPQRGLGSLMQMRPGEKL